MKRDQVVRILLVEDSPGDARLIKEALSETEKIRTEIDHVDSLGEMRKRFSAAAYDLIILDLSLPDASGLATVSRTNQIAPETAIVVLTGLNDEDLAIKAVQQGAQDYLVKGQADARSLEKVILYALERNQAKLRIGALKNELARALIEIDEELEISASIQRKIIQQRVPDNWKESVSIYYSFAKKIGGDIFDIVDLPDGRTAFVVADGSGHSVHAALISIMFKLSFTHQLERAGGPRDLIEKINRELQPFFLENMFFTVFSAWVDRKRGSLAYSNAGHPAQYLVSPERNRIIRLKHEGIPICINPDTSYTEERIETRKGDKLVLFTDGIYECFDDCGGQFGEEKLKDLLKQNIRLPVSDLRRKVIETAETYNGQVMENSFGQRDDSILIVAEL